MSIRREQDEKGVTDELTLLRKGAHHIVVGCFREPPKMREGAVHIVGTGPQQVRGLRLWRATRVHLAQRLQGSN